MSLSKQETRRLLKERLNSLATEILIEKGLSLSKNFSDLLDSLPKLLPSLHREFILGAYAPLKKEADWTQGFNGLNGRMAFPSIDKTRGMEFRLADLEQLVENHDFGVAIKGPSSTAKIVEPAVLLIPGLGFTVKGERLGRGGGYYDRYLENYIGIKIGICLEEQLCLEIPVEPHDFLMDVVLTDKRVIILANSLKGE